MRRTGVHYETEGVWWNWFGPIFAGDIRGPCVSRMRGVASLVKASRREMDVKLVGEMLYLRRAVNHGGEVLDPYIAKARNKDIALVFYGEGATASMRR